MTKNNSISFKEKGKRVENPTTLKERVEKRLGRKLGTDLGRIRDDSGRYRASDGYQNSPPKEKRASKEVHLRIPPNLWVEMRLRMNENGYITAKEFALESIREHLRYLNRGDEMGASLRMGGNSVTRKKPRGSKQ